MLQLELKINNNGLRFLWHFNACLHTVIKRRLNVNNNSNNNNGDNIIGIGNGINGSYMIELD